MTAGPLIEIEGLRVVFHGDDGRTTHAVDSVDLSVANGATLGLVGESGCGKSVTSLAIMGLLSRHSAEVSGSIRFDGFDLLDVYVGPEGVLTGSMRLAQEAKERARALERKQEIERRRRELDRRRQALETEITSKREQFASVEEELMTLLDQDMASAEQAELDRTAMSRSRRADAAPTDEPRTRPRNNKRESRRTPS